MDDNLKGLSRRATTVLSTHNLASREEIVAFLKQGKSLLSFRNLGRKTNVEICEWLGLPEPKRTQPVIVCPQCNYVFLGPCKKNERPV